MNQREQLVFVEVSKEDFLKVFSKFSSGEPNTYYSGNKIESTRQGRKYYYEYAGLVFVTDVE